MFRLLFQDGEYQISEEILNLNDHFRTYLTGCSKESQSRIIHLPNLSNEVGTIFFELLGMDLEMGSRHLAHLRGIKECSPELSEAAEEYLEPKIRDALILSEILVGPNFDERFLDFNHSDLHEFVRLSVKFLDEAGYSWYPPYLEVVQYLLGFSNLPRRYPGPVNPKILQQARNYDETLGFNLSNETMSNLTSIRLTSLSIDISLFSHLRRLVLKLDDFDGSLAPLLNLEYLETNLELSNFTSLPNLNELHYTYSGYLRNLIPITPVILPNLRILHLDGYFCSGAVQNLLNQVAQIESLTVEMWRELFVELLEVPLDLTQLPNLRSVSFRYGSETCDDQIVNFGKLPLTTLQLPFVDETSLPQSLQHLIVENYSDSLESVNRLTNLIDLKCGSDLGISGILEYLPTLVSADLHGFQELTLQHLPHLTNLTLRKIETVHLDDLPKLASLSLDEVNLVASAFPSLAKLEIGNRVKFDFRSFEAAPITSLKVRGYVFPAKALESFPHLTDLSFSWCPESLRPLPHLTTLNLVCHNDLNLSDYFFSVRDLTYSGNWIPLDRFPNLESLNLTFYDEPISDGDISSLIHLEHLTITQPKKLTEIRLSQTGLFGFQYLQMLTLNFRPKNFEYVQLSDHLGHLLLVQIFEDFQSSIN